MIQAVEQIRSRPEHVEALTEYLERMLQRVKEGEFETLYCVWIDSKGNSTTCFKGREPAKLERIGMLALLLHDVCDGSVVT